MKYSFVSQYKKISFRVGLVMSVLGLVVSASVAHAMTPTLSLSLQNDNNTVTLNVTGDPNQSVLLFYNKTNAGATILPLGTTSSNGTFSLGISSSADGIASNTPVYVTTGGIYGTQSNTVSWPYVTTTSTTGSMTLSQTGVAVGIGQTSTVTLSNYSSGTPYLSNNSNAAVANVNVSGSTVTITGISNGSTVATICTTGNTTNCPSVYVTVANSGAQTLYFSQNNLTITPGQTIPITVSGGTGIYTILNNSNANVIQAAISGTTVNLSTSSTNGTASITVCSSDMSSCGILNVTAGTANSSSVVTFSQNAPTVSIGQTVTVSMYGGSSGAYYVSTNSNPSIVQTTLTNSTTMSLLGLASGSSNITVCSSAGGCGTLTVSVTYVSNGGTIALSQSTLSLLIGQTLSVTISGGTAPYNLPNPSGSVYQASISGNILTVTGVSTGSTWFNVCSAAGGCTSLTVTVNGTGTSSYNSPVLSQSSLSLTQGQSNTVIITGSGSYYISNNSAPGVASASISGSSLYVSAISSGSTNISICQSGGSCTTAYVTVSSSSTTNTVITLGQVDTTLTVGQNTLVSISGNGSYYVSNNTTPSVVSASISGTSLSLSGIAAGSANISVCQSGGSCTTAYVNVTGTTTTTTTTTPSASIYTFSTHLAFGDTGNDVSELQQLLAGWGFFAATPNGRFGPATQAAVEAFQKAHGLGQTGEVGPATRNELNQLQATSGGSVTRAQQIQTIQQEIAQLQAQLTALQAGQ